MSEPRLTISAPAELLREIQVDLRRAGVPCTPERAGSVPRAKSGDGSLTSLLIGGLVSAAGLRALSQVLVAVVRRSEKRRVEIRLGEQVLVIDGASARDGRAALDGFLERTRDDAA